MLGFVESAINSFFLKNSSSQESDGADFLSKLPYLEYEPVYKFHRLRDGRLGAAWIFDDVPLDTEIEMKGRVNIMRTVTEMLNTCIAGTHIQVIKRVNGNIKEYFDKMKETYIHGEPISRRIMEEDIKKIIKGASEKSLFTHKNKECWVKQTDNMITLTYTPVFTSQKKNTGDKFNSIHEKNYVASAKLFSKVCSNIEAAFSKLGIEQKRVDGDGLQKYLDQWFNPVSSLKQRPTKYRDDIPMYKNILRNSPKSTCRGYEFEGKRSTVLTVEEPASAPRHNRNESQF